MARGLALAVSCVSAAEAQTLDLYDESVLRPIQLTFHQRDWWQQLTTNYWSKTYIKADLKFAGRTYKDVGVRFRGNSSYKAVSSRKKPFKISMDAFVPGQRLAGHRTLNLNNGFRDPTFVREVLSYWIFRRYEPAPRANFVTLSINGEDFGVYVNVEQINKDLLREWFEDDEGNRYRAERQPGASANASALVWLGPAIAPYKLGYELKNAKPNNPWVDVVRLCDVLNNTPAAKLPLELPKVLDVDEALRHLAANNLLPAIDSYIGNTAHNYYLYHDGHHARFALLPWDLNASFGGNAWLTVGQKQRLDPFYFETHPGRPLLGRVLAHAPWRARYVAHLQTMLDEVYDWKVLGPKVAALQKTIRAAVQKDPKRLYPFAQFDQNVKQDVRIRVRFNLQWIPGLEPMVRQRRQFLLAHSALKNRGPALSQLRATPARPTVQDTVWVTARVGAGTPAARMTLHWRVRGPFVEQPMFDDGRHGDGAAGDGVYGAAIAPQGYGAVVQYYVSGMAASGATTFLPPAAAHRAPRYDVQWPRAQPGVTLNELLAKNVRGIVDEKGEHEDWFEIYNPLPRTVDLSGFYLTDDLRIPKRWQVPAGTTLAPGAVLLVWADDEPKDGRMHARFKLSAGGEELAIFARDGVSLVDSVRFGPQQPDVSTGRLQDGNGPWVTYLQPSPRARNAPGSCGIRLYSAPDSSAHRLRWTLAGRPGLGLPVTLSLRGAPPGATAFLFVAPGPALAALDGRVWLLLGPPLAGPVPLPIGASGGFDAPFTIPNAPGLAGRRLVSQLFAWDAQGSQASNALEITFCR